MGFVIHMSHVPVFLRPISFVLRECKVVADFTLGMGGHSQAFLESGSRVIGIDRDPHRRVTMDRLTEQFGSQFVGVRAKWSELESKAEMKDLIGEVDGIVMDLGLCTTQLVESGRGFSFKKPDEPLDMRMDGDSGGITAADILNTFSQERLTEMLVQLGELGMKRAGILSNLIARRRQDAPFRVVGDVTPIFRKERTGLPPRKMDPCTLPFQALRMTVNDEVQELMAGLSFAEKLLRSGGIITVLSYHSIEDRIVKKYLELASSQKRQDKNPTFTYDKKFVRPDEEEVYNNPSSSSAILRKAVRTQFPASNDTVEALQKITFKRQYQPESLTHV